MAGNQYWSCGSGLQLLAGADPLTRLMMDADGVSVSELESLVRRISQTLALRLSGRSDMKQ